MGFLDKIKGILFDEEEVEIPEIKREPKNSNKSEVVIHEEEDENPIKEIKVPKEDFSDKENYKSESTFTFPIDFDDEPVIIDKPKPRVEERRVEPKKETRDYSDFLNRREEKKKFKPTPIISPVYGVLDQNYKKEDVVVKSDILRSPKELTLEEVRKRAFGTLEDDLEQNLTQDIEKETEDDKVIKLKETLEKKKDITVEAPVDKMKTIGELIEEESVEVDIPVIDSINDDEVEYNNDEVILEEPKNTIEDLLEEDEEMKESYDEDEIDDDEADLFSLIDSMYEEKGE